MEHFCFQVGYKCKIILVLGIKATIIYPATEQHIKKFEKTQLFIVEETKDIYESITLPHILKRQLSLQV